MITFIGKVTHPTEDAAAQALEKAREADALSAAEPGCIHHMHAQDSRDKRVIWLLHSYKTTADVEAHLKADYYPALKAAISDGAIAFEAKQYVGMEAFNFLVEH